MVKEAVYGRGKVGRTKVGRTKVGRTIDGLTILRNNNPSWTSVKETPYDANNDLLTFNKNKT